MPVDETIAKAWGKLHGKEAVHIDGPFGGWVMLKVPLRDALIPDPATQPWEWVKAFDSVNIYRLGEKRWGKDATLVELAHENDGEGHGDTPEAALEAAIRVWADAGKEAGR